VNATKNSTPTCRPSQSSTSALACAVLAFGALLLVAGCNTTAGFGKDVEAAGSGISNAAEKAK
jgi:predicted small secreted protein